MNTIDTTTADKDQLVEFAKTEYKVTIDPRTKLETIRVRVQGLIDGVLPEVIAEDMATPGASGKRYVRNINNGNVYEWQENLVGEQFVACDVDGNTV